MCKILLVDSSATARCLVAERLREATYIVREACDAQEAQELLRETSVDLVVLDPDLKRGSGIDLVKSIQSDDLLKIIPILVYTTSESTELQRPLRRSKFVGSFHKAQDSFEDLRNLVDELTANLKQFMSTRGASLSKVEIKVRSNTRLKAGKRKSARASRPSSSSSPSSMN